MLIKEHKILIVKELYSFRKFWKRYQREVSKKNPTVVLHFRIATSGKIDLGNCHPFMIDKEHAFCHNGIIPAMAKKKSELSDTSWFKTKILRNLPKGWFGNSAITQLLEKYVNTGKLVFMKDSGEVLIVNRHLGIEEEGVWYSNTSYQKNYGYYFPTNYFPVKYPPNPYQLNTTVHNTPRSSLTIKRSQDFDTCLVCGNALASKSEETFGVCADCFQDDYT